MVQNSSPPSAATTCDEAQDPVRADMARLSEEVDKLVRRHHQDLARCFDDFFFKRRELQSGPPGACGWCDDLELHGDAASGQQRGNGNPAVELHAPSQTWAGVLPIPLSPSPSTTELRSGSKATNRLVKQVTETKRKKDTKVHELLHGMDSIIERTCLQRITRSRYYEWFSGTLILMNAVFIGWQTQHTAHDAQSSAMVNVMQTSEVPTGFLAAEVIFSLLFAVELGLRWVCEGLIGFFMDDEMGWNIMDVAIVFLSILDLIIYAFVEDEESRVTGNVSMLRVVRVVRIVRVVRVIRIMRFFRELRMMVFSILGSMKSLLWVMVVFCMTFYVFGITFTAAVNSELSNIAVWTQAEFADLAEYFGSLDRSVLSLFMAMSGGNDWVEYYNALKPLPAQYKTLFLLYITFAIFGVMNIVTGVFVDSAMQVSMNDKDIIVHEELESKKSYLRSMRELFEEMDTSNEGTVSLEEFENQLDDERVIAYFNALKLDVSDAQTLFRLLDHDRSNEVNIDEFITGCYRLQGASRALDMKIMQHEVRYLQENFAGLKEGIEKVKSLILETRRASPLQP